MRSWEYNVSRGGKGISSVKHRFEPRRKRGPRTEWQQLGSSVKRPLVMVQALGSRAPPSDSFTRAGNSEARTAPGLAAPGAPARSKPTRSRGQGTSRMAGRQKEITEAAIPQADFPCKCRSAAAAVAMFVSPPVRGAVAVPVIVRVPPGHPSQHRRVPRGFTAGRGELESGRHLHRHPHPRSRPVTGVQVVLCRDNAMLPLHLLFGKR